MARPDTRQNTVSIGGGQSHQTQTIIAGIIIAATLLVGFFVVDAIADSVPATETDSVINESVGTVVFESQSDSYFYTVNENGSDEVGSFQDDESVFNTNSDTQLTEGTDYEWFPDNGTLRVDNTSAVGDNTDDTVITYSWTTQMGGFHQTLNRIGDGLLIGGVVIIVLFAAVILRVLRGL